MQAIQTKYIPATDRHGSRVRAKCSRGFITVAYPHELSGSDVHRFAAKALVAKFIKADTKLYGTPPDKNPWGRAFVSGGLADGTEVHVFIGELYRAGREYLEQTSVSNRRELRKALLQYA